MDEQINIENSDKNNNKVKPKTIKRFLSFVWELSKIIIVALVIVLPIRYFLFQPFIVKGASMVPNFETGNYLIVDEISYRFSGFERGNVVVFKYPLDESQKFIKRIIALPGETVEVRDGKITITKQNQETLVLDEKNYLPNLPVTSGDIKISLKDDEYFVLGDNREYSYDSRRWGVLPKKEIIGKAFLRLFPVSAIGIIGTPSY